jgi:hypothetical protein
MPSFAFTPGRLTYLGGGVALEPIRFTFVPGSLNYSGGSIDIGPDFGFGLTGKSLRLDRLQRAVPIGGPQGPSMQFQALWQKNCEAIEAAYLAQQGEIDTLAEIVAGLQAAQQAAAQANQGVETLNAGISLQSSRTEPVDGLLSATSDGTVTIAAHERVYTTGATETRVNVNGGSLSGFAQGAFVRVFYNDAARAGGAVSYQGTTGEVTQTGDTHVIGGVTIPQVGSPPSSGEGTTPPGYVRPKNPDENIQ